jgi:hypothetical protein
LTYLDLVKNDFTTLPPALASATALRKLGLGINPELAVTAEDVNSILLRMPNLEQLQVAQTNTAPAVEEYLERRLPGVNLPEDFPMLGW